MSIFNEAVKRPAGERCAFLEDACGSDTELRNEVESLLEADSRSHCLLDRPVLGPGFNVSQYAEVDPALTAAIPERVGSYRIKGLLGAGGMGIVYRAEQEQPRRLVALKVIRPDRTSPSLRRRFLSEMESLGRLRHPGIAQIHEAGTADTVHGPWPYIVMELVEGTPLSQYANSEELDDRQRLDLLAKICDAVEHAHERSVIHRDLKPANILVENRGGEIQPRILDFGIARLLDHDIAAVTQVTACGQPLGTLTYMSPEQVGGVSKEIDARSDVYSLAIIGYELLSGQLPVALKGKSVFSAMEAIREEPATRLGLVDRCFRGDLSVVFAKALAKEKELRYESAAAFAADIRRYLAGRPIVGRGVNPWYATLKFARRNWEAALTIALCVVICSSAIAWGWNSASKKTRHYQETKDLAGFLAGDFAANLDQIGGTTQLRRELLQQLRSYIETQLEMDENDVGLISARADVLTRLSDIDCDENDSISALETRSQVHGIRQWLVEASPNDPERLADLSITKVKIGDIHKEWRQFSAAEQWYTESLRIDERLAEQYPDSRRFLSNLAWSYSRLGALTARLGRFDEARPLLTRATSTYERLAALNPSDADATNGMRETEGLLAMWAEQQGCFQTHEAHLRAALEYALRTVELAPDNRRYATSLASARMALARHLSREGNFEEATSLLSQVNTAVEKYINLDPDDVINQLLQWNFLIHTCDLELKRGKLQEALTAAEHAIAVAEKLCEEKGDRVAHMRQIAKSLHSAYMVASLLNLEDQAITYRLRNRRILREITEHNTADSGDFETYAADLLDSKLGCGVDSKAALAAAQRSVDLSEGKIAGCWRMLGRAYEAAGNTDKAIESLEMSLKLPSGFAPEVKASIIARLDRLREEGKR